MNGSSARSLFLECLFGWPIVGPVSIVSVYWMLAIVLLASVVDSSPSCSTWCCESFPSPFRVWVVQVSAVVFCPPASISICFCLFFSLFGRCCCCARCGLFRFDDSMLVVLLVEASPCFGASRPSLSVPNERPFVVEIEEITCISSNWLLNDLYVEPSSGHGKSQSWG